MAEVPIEPTFVASWNGGPATQCAVRELSRGQPLLESIVAGVQLVEDDPEEMSVGYGGLPNEEGVVELDAAVMDGSTHRAGAVAGLRGIRHAAAVALNVLKRTDHALLVGEGAKKFALQCGFKEEDLLTDAAREAWLAWKGELSERDAWLGAKELQGAGGGDFGAARWAGHAENPTPGGPPQATGAPSPGRSGGMPKVPFTFGTVHVSGVDGLGRMASCTSTSGLSYKIPGRAGDTPIVGAGLYTDGLVGSAGCTGRGEATMQSCAAFSVVREMEAGLDPTEACLSVLRRIVRNTREMRLLGGDGTPHFNCTLYALRRDGAAGSAAIHPGYTYVVQRGDRTDLCKCASLFAAT